MDQHNYINIHLERCAGLIAFCLPHRNWIDLLIPAQVSVTIAPGQSTNKANEDSYMELLEMTALIFTQEGKIIERICVAVTEDLLC